MLSVKKSSRAPFSQSLTRNRGIESASRWRSTGCDGSATIVIQFIVSKAFRHFPALRSRCLGDPDSLLEIARHPEAATGLPTAQSDRFSLILHDLRMGGAWKRTNRGRLQQTEEMLRTYIAPELRPGLIFLDIGASDGITTVEAVRALREAFGDGVQAIATDRNIWLL